MIFTISKVIILNPVHLELETLILGTQAGDIKKHINTLILYILQCALVHI